MDQHIVSYPISQGKLLNFVALVTVPGGEGKALEGPSAVDVPNAEMAAHYKDWEPEVLELLEVRSNYSSSLVDKLPYRVSDLPVH